MYRLTRISLAYPRATLLVLGLITVIFAAGLPRLRTEFGYRVLVGEDHPAIQLLDGLIDRFGGGLPVQIAWECGDGHPCKSVFDETSLRMAHEVTTGLSPVPGIQNVRGPSNAALLVPAPDGFAIRRFVERGALVSDAEALAARALDDPLWVGNFISADGSVGVIVVQASESDSESHVRIVDAIDEVLEPFEDSGFRFYLVGDPVDNTVIGRDLAKSTANLIPFTVLVIAVVLFLLSRSVASVMIAVGTMAIALVWTFGLLAWLDWPQDGILEVLAPLILVVGVCDAVHVLSRYAAELDSRVDTQSGSPQADALLKTARDVGSPCLVTTLTTASAFGSFTTSALDTFVRFGVISAFGVLACLVLTFTLLPVLIRMVPVGRVRAVRASAAWDSGLDAMVRTSERRAVPILGVAGILFAVCGIGWIGHLRADTHWLEALGEHSRVVQSIRFFEERVRPAESLEIEIVLPSTAALEEPETLRIASRFVDAVTKSEGLGSATSVLNVIGRINRLLHDDDPASERPGETRAANAEILELISFDDPGMLESWISFDRSRFRISVEAPLQSYSNRGEVLDFVRTQARSTLPPDWAVHLSGEYAIGFDWIRDVQQTQLRSFPIALALVFAMVALFFGSIRLAFAATVPTLLPVVVTLGVMGWVGMSLDVGRAMIAAILIGIGVDDSIHLLDHYKVRRAAGADPREAIRQAMLHVGRAVVTTSLALSLGFLTLMASAWQTISSFGFFVALAILGALASALFVLPALLFALSSGERASDPRPS